MRDTRRYEKIMRELELADRLERQVETDAERAFLRILAADTSHLPGVKSARVRSWTGVRQNAAVTATGWQSFNVPKNTSFMSLIVVGGGAGGGAGFSGASASARGGGGGGASGAIARALFLTSALPRELFLFAGNYGAGGGAPGITGTVGGRSCVTDRPNTLGTAANSILTSGAAASGGGVGGTAAGAQAGGAAETIGTIAANLYLGWALSAFFVVGMAGAAGGALGAVGGSITFGSVANLPLTGGAGGGSVTTTNTDVAGGGITGAGLVPTIPGGLAAAGPGSPGHSWQNPWFQTGGTGGGTAGAAGTGGAGGKAGGVGCGGGGGGSGVTGAIGGDGSPGLVMFAWW